MRNLYEIACRSENLFQAWLHIKEKGSAGGIDEVSIDDFNTGLQQNLKELNEELLSLSYSPEPYKQILIPKDDNEFRKLAMMTIRDKIVQHAVRMVIEPILDKKFLDVSYAYRPGKSPYQAIRRVQHLINVEKRKFACLCDIDRFFDNIPHERLLNRLAKVIFDEQINRLMEIWIRMGTIDASMQWKEQSAGIPQGGILSPLLSNLYLHPFDQVMVNNKWGYVRYADDFLVLTHSQKQAETALLAIDKTLRIQHGLKLNDDKRIVHVDEGFTFLGVLIKEGKADITGEKHQILVERLSSAITVKDAVLNPDLALKIKGIKQYYARLVPKAALEKIDSDFIDALKTKLKKAYQDEKFSHKYQLEAMLAGISYLSEPYKTNKEKIDKDIVKYVLGIGESVLKSPQPNDKGKPPAPEKVIEARKIEYRDLEAQGFELVIDSFGVFVGKSQNFITVKDHGKTVQKIKTHSLKNITVMTQGVTLSSNVIRFCSERNIPIDFLYSDGKPYAKMFYPSFASVSTYIDQINAFNNGKGRDLVLAIVRAKIKNQLNLLKYHAKYRLSKDMDFARVFSEKTRKMAGIAKDISQATGDNFEEIRQSLFGLEGSSAGMYWAIIYEILNDYTDFTKREKQGAKDLVNNMLNYGYGILYARVWQVLMKAGLNPWIGYLHSTERDAPALVYDFIEQFRQQAVDRVVIAMITKGEKNEVEDGKLTDETRKRLATKILERLHRDEEFRGRQMRFSEIMQFQADQLAQYLAGKIRTYKPYISKW